MADKTTTENKSATATTAEKETPLTAEGIGTLTYERAVKHFGKARAVEVMKRVASIGGYGMFKDEELKSRMFGGLAMPVTDHEMQTAAQKEEAAEQIKRINQYYSTLK